MKITPQLFAKDMQETMDFYIQLGFEARDVMQNGDEIESMLLVYKDNENAAILFRPQKNSELANAEAVQINIEEGENDVAWHQKERYPGPREENIVDPNGYKLIFLKSNQTPS